MYVSNNGFMSDIFNWVKNTVKSGKIKSKLIELLQYIRQNDELVIIILRSTTGVWCKMFETVNVFIVMPLCRPPLFFPLFGSAQIDNVSADAIFLSANHFCIGCLFGCGCDLLMIFFSNFIDIHDYHYLQTRLQLTTRPQQRASPQPRVVVRRRAWSCRMMSTNRWPTLWCSTCGNKRRRLRVSKLSKLGGW